MRITKILTCLLCLFIAVSAFAEETHINGIEQGGGSASVSDTPYGAGWDGDTTTGASKNALYDKIETISAGSLPASTDGQILQSNNGTYESTSTLDSIAFNMGGSQSNLLYDTGSNFLLDTDTSVNHVWSASKITSELALKASDSADTNTIEWVYSDLTATQTGKYIRIPTASAWTTAYIMCDAAETTTPVAFDLYMKSTISGTATELTSATSELTMSTTNAYVDAIDISGFTDPVAGAWVRLDIATVADTATECSVALVLENN